MSGSEPGLVFGTSTLKRVVDKLTKEFLRAFDNVDLFNSINL